MGVMSIIKDRIQGKAPKGARRSPKWKQVKTAHLQKHPACEICGAKEKLEVHHIIPFHLAPDLELEPKNLITLCENKKYGLNCHLAIGHLGNYSKFNPSVVADAIYWRLRIGKADSNDPI